MLRRASRVLVGVMAATLVAGCGVADQASPAATPRLQPATSAPLPSPAPARTETIDVATVPASIDETYLEAVMAVLDSQYAKVFRRAQEAGELGEQFQAGMHALQTPQEAKVQIDGFRKHIGIDGLARPPRPPTANVQQILEATPTCVYFTAIRDVQPLVAEPLNVVQPYYIALARNQPNELNPTAWRIALDTFYRERDPPTNVCKGG